MNFSLGRRPWYVFHRDLLAANHLSNDETRDAVEIPGGLPNVRVSNLWQLLHHAIDRLVGKIFRIAESFGHKDPDQTSADYFIFLPGYFAVWVKPG